MAKKKIVITISKEELRKIEKRKHRQELIDAGVYNIHKPKVHKDKKNSYKRKTKHPKKDDE